MTDGITGRVAIVVPCYNESDRLNIEEFTRFSRKNKHIHFIFIDDGSTDETLMLIKRICASSPRGFSYIDLDRNHGKAEAVRQGFLKAIAMKFEKIGYWDADLATPLQSINDFIPVLDNNNNPLCQDCCRMSENSL